MKSSYVIVVTLIGLYSVTGSDDWSYWGEHDPTHWPGLCATGKQQSPINIVTEKAVKTDIGALKFIGYNLAIFGNVVNNGHSVQIQLHHTPIYLEGADLPSRYILEQMHFHWPAEHTVDENRDILEIHFVHYNSDYQNMSMATEHKDGIVVVAALFELKDTDNTDLLLILAMTESVSEAVGNSVKIPKSTVIPSRFLPTDRTSYYRYDGSLTTPGCQESVMWFVFTQKLWISERELNVFKNIKTNNGPLSFNHRPTQPLGEREVYLNLEGYSAATGIAPNLFLACSSFLLIILLCSKL